MTPASVAALRNCHLFLVATGAGAGLQLDLWMTPGTSSFLVGAAFPYATDDTDDFLGFTPTKYCDETEALQLAMEAYIRACRHKQLTKSPKEAVGLAITACVASLKGAPHRGEHRAHIAAVSERGGFHEKIVLPKGVGEYRRASDNAMVETVTEDSLLMALGEPLYSSDSDVKRVSDQRLREILFMHPFFSETRTRHATASGITSFYPGSFNPLHDGHREAIADIVKSTYEICIDSVHKPSLTIPQALARVPQFQLERQHGAVSSVLFTQQDPLFVDKFPSHADKYFIIGADALRSLLDPQWGVPKETIFAEIVRYNIGFWTVDRYVNGTLLQASKIIDSLPDNIQGHFIELNVEPSRLSSSAIRGA